MALILYLPEGNDWDVQFTEFLHEASPATDFTICHSVDGLAEILRTRFYAIKVAALVVHSREELKQIALLKDFLEGLFLLLVVPDEDAETIAQAHRLSPRFVTPINGDREEMKIVLQRMLERYDWPAFNTIESLN